MHAVIIARGEPGGEPYVKRFQFGDPDDGVFAASCQKIRGELQGRRRININGALLLFLEFVASSMKDRAGADQIRDGASSLLSPDQVMIGVPEMLARVDFEVTAHGRKFTVSIDRPIPVQDFAFGSAR